MINLWGTGYGIGVQSSTQYFRTDAHFAWYQGGSHDNNELSAGANGTVQMALKSGNLGVGTANPGSRLDVNGDARISGNGGLYFFNAANSLYWTIVPEWGDAGDPDLFFDYSGNPSSWVSGWLEPQGGGWKSSSDGRLKEDVAPLEDVLSGIMKLSPKSYRFINSTKARKSIGFIAQNVEEIFPDLVTESRGYKGLGYSDFAVLAIAAIQEQQSLITALQATIEGFEGRLPRRQTDRTTRRTERGDGLNGETD